ncbi:MAG TPA: DNA/RNA non-specific endonuclease [Chryseosolibacter sp.]
MASIGFQTDFIEAKKGLTVSEPKLNATQTKDRAPVGGAQDGKLDYIHYSVLLSKSRKFPYYTATNIDGKQYVRVKRADVFDSGRDEWDEDDRAGTFQWGQKLYDAPKSYFDRGHMTKREDPQWGASYESAREAAQDTFYFTNCVPQLADLNQKIWASLETYILSKESVANKLRINVFTGPVLSKDDPEFVTRVNGVAVQIPVLFWKVIYYTTDGKALSRVAFIMGQEDLLLSRGIAERRVPARVLDTFFAPTRNLFMDYEDAETYQVNIKTIETLSGLKFHRAKEPYKDARPIKLIKKVIQAKAKKTLMRPSLNPDLSTTLDFKITNLKL